MKSKKNIYELIFLSLIFFYISVIFFTAQGTQNYDSWLLYINLANTYGIIDGYSFRVDTYPPLSTLIMKVFYDMLSFLNFEIFFIIKFVVIFFFYLSLLTIYFYSKSVLLSVFFIITFLISVMGMIDLDIVFAFFLILSLIALKKKNILLFSIFYCISILIKWQPITIFPFLALYISEFNFSHLKLFKNLSFNKLFNLKNIMISSLVVFTFIIIFSLTYGFLPVAKSFNAAISHNLTSGNALNFNWIITWILTVSDGSYSEQIIFRRINSESPYYVYLGSLIFFIILIFLIFSFAKKENRNIEDVYYYCALAFFALFTFNKGVHQNHLFTSALLFFLLAIENKKFLLHAVITSGIFNFNLIIFYGINGSGSQGRMTPVYGIFDVSLIIASLNIFCFIYTFYLFLRKKHFLN